MAFPVFLCDSNISQTFYEVYIYLPLVILLQNPFVQNGAGKSDTSLETPRIEVGCMPYIRFAKMMHRRM